MSTNSATHSITTRSLSISVMPSDHSEKYSSSLSPKMLLTAASAHKTYKENVLPLKQNSAPHMRSQNVSVAPPLLDLYEGSEIVPNPPVRLTTNNARRLSVLQAMNLSAS